MSPSIVLIVTLCLICTLQSSVTTTSTSGGRPRFVPVSPRISLSLNKDLLDWNDAFKECKSWNATMAFPNTPDEGRMLHGFVLNSLTNATKEIHAGFHSLFSSDNYTTIEGYDTDTYGYLQWNPESENGTDQRCGAFTVDGLKTIDCSTKLESVCEYKGTMAWEDVPGFGSYLFIDLNMDWLSAIGLCKMETANLLMLRSQAEYDAILKHYTDTGVVNGTLDLFYGAHQYFGDNFYLTLGDDPIEDSGYDVWAPGEPGDVTSADFPLVGLRLTDPNTPDSESGLFVLPSDIGAMPYICKRELH